MRSGHKKDETSSEERSKRCKKAMYETSSASEFRLLRTPSDSRAQHRFNPHPSERVTHYTKHTCDFSAEVFELCGSYLYNSGGIAGSVPLCSTKETPSKHSVARDERSNGKIRITSDRQCEKLPKQIAYTQKGNQLLFGPASGLGDLCFFFC